MKTLLLKIEPVVWLLFGQGVLVGTILLTGWIAVVGLAVPLGLVPEDALAWQRVHALGSTLIGRLVLLALIALPLWKGAHHCRHLSLDMNGAARDTVIAPLLYGLAALGSALAIVAVARL